jgi:hypothetical protein
MKYFMIFKNVYKNLILETKLACEEKYDEISSQA